MNMVFFKILIGHLYKKPCLPVVQENIAHAKVITSFSNMTRTVFGRNTLSARGFIYIYRDVTPDVLLINKMSSFEYITCLRSYAPIKNLRQNHGF